MTLTILIDLDGTLLSNDIDSFIPIYLEELSRHLDPIPPQRIIREILFATTKMMENQSPVDTLEDVFDSHFYPAIGITKLELRDKIESFYKFVYPGLKQYTSQKSDAIEFINESVKQNYQIVIATNPVFPRTATQQRLCWAGLSPKEFPFSIISTYETFHFAKPSLSYYAELLGRLGWPVEPVLMIGNDFDMDIQPANLLNVQTFLLNDSGGDPGDNFENRSGYGDFSTLSSWMNHVSSTNLGYSYQNIESLLAIIRSTPAVLHTINKELPNSAWTFTPGIREWSIEEIVTHLGEMDTRVNIPRITEILSHEKHFFPNAELDQRISSQINNAANKIPVFHEYLVYRMKLIQILDMIPAYEWKKSIKSGDFENPILLEVCRNIAAHDQDHIRQIKRLI